jgi:hypothetical protein
MPIWPYANIRESELGSAVYRATRVIVNNEEAIHAAEMAVWEARVESIEPRCAPDSFWNAILI